MSRKQKAHLWLIKPSNYDDDGYVVTYFRGVLPSNTLNCLAALTEDVIENKSLGPDFEIRLHRLDETVQKIPVSKICRSGRHSRVPPIVCLVGVQSNQFPRAADLALQLRAGGCTVLIGGFHVSGLLSMLSEVPPDMQRLMDAGITLVKGEVEESWGDILKDAVCGCLKPLYDFSNEKPDLFEKPIPVIDRRLMKRFTCSRFATIDCGRGCPFNCSFCTIINVQGRKMRVRSPECIATAVRKNWHVNGVTYYFFTDDNFARNPQWEAIFDKLIELREVEEIPVTFMMQVDVLSYQIRRFVEKARRAGCSQVFIGMESINPESLKDAAKAQNRAADYVQLIETWRGAGVATHAGYIIGFPHDSTETVRSDLQRLIHEIQVDQVSFFILTPLPGSRDHLHMVQNRLYLDPDYNRYDSMHETMRYTGFPVPGSLKKLYFEAWETFYSFENMKRILLRAHPRNYWNIFRNFIWYKNAVMIEKRHPMMAGFFRRKSRKAMRQGTPRPERRHFLRKRLLEIREMIAGELRLILEMEELWLQTRQRGAAETRIIEEMRKMRANVCRRLSVAEIQLAHARARLRIPTIRVPSRLVLYWKQWNLWLSQSTLYTRSDMQAYWDSLFVRRRQRRLLRISPFRLVSLVWLEAQLLFLFSLAVLRAREE